MANCNFKTVIHSPPVADDGFVKALFGTDILGLSERILRGEYDHIIKKESQKDAKQTSNP
ncbi:MAG: hypothetical protein QM401_04175 [Bacillota bacterium]|nr:hypothetical protein [Bacillota bacterium]